MELERARKALIELMYRNPLKHDGHAYDLALAAWGLGIAKEPPDEQEFGQDILADKDNSLTDYLKLMTRRYEEER